MFKNITIAIDGTAASGKGTLAKSLCKEFNYAYLDTGKLYRASALIIRKENINSKKKKRYRKSSQKF
jgi:cytidylate kinase